MTRLRRYGLTWFPYHAPQQTRWFYTSWGRRRFAKTLYRSDLATTLGKAW